LRASPLSDSFVYFCFYVFLSNRAAQRKENS
jgi:hypothetical protein